MDEPNPPSFPETSKKKVGLGKGLQSLLGDNRECPVSNADKAFHPEWIRDPKVKLKFCLLAQDFYRQRYPGSKVTYDNSYSENLMLSCDKALVVNFRVQARAAGWPMDTLVIVNIHNLQKMKGKDPLLELLEFVVIAQKEVGYINLGLENPGGRLEQLIEKFDFEELDHYKMFWTISIESLKKHSGF